MSPIEKLGVRQLVQVLKHARGGHIGFDPFRDARTNTRAALLKYLLETCTDAQIIAGIQSLTVVTNTDTEITLPMVQTYAESAERKQVHAAVAQALTPPNTDPAAELAALLRRLATDNAKAPLDTQAVVTLIEDQLDKRFDLKGALESLKAMTEAHLATLKAPTVVHVVTTQTMTTQDMGIQHKHFATLLKMAQARTRDGLRLNIWLKGPAGSGKTVAAKHVATALALPFQFNGAISTEYDLMGYKDAVGTYHRTAFRDIFEHGGVYLFDEIDSSLPKAVLAFNAALANGECRFPDGMINRHKDCVVIAGANTAGQGATSEYVGRMKQDLAFLNRFVLLDWPLDETLESALSSNTSWVVRVQTLRARLKDRAVKNHIISPRATFYGEALLAAGLDQETVEQCVLKQGLSDDTWAELCR